MLRALLLAVAAASASAFSVVTPVTAAVRPVVAAKAAPLMVLEPTSLDAASQLLAMSIPIPAYTPAKVWPRPSALVWPELCLWPGRFVSADPFAHATRTPVQSQL